MKRIVWVILLSSFSATALVRAQQPVSVPLERVKRVYVLDQVKGENFDKLLASRLRAWGQFEIVTDPGQDHDVVLSALYGCDPFSFRYVDVSRKAGWTVCDIRLLDADLIKRGKSSTVWEMPLGVLQDLHAPPTSSEKIADGFIVQLRKDFEIATRARKPDPSPSLLQVRTVYVARGDVSDLESMPFEQTLFWSLASTKKRKLVGDCEHGYESIIVGIKLVCGLWQADAILVSTGTEGAGSRTRSENTTRGTFSGTSQGTYSGTTVETGDVTHSDGTYSGTTVGRIDARNSGSIWQEQFSAGGAVLIDRHTARTIWFTAKDDSAGWAATLATRGTAGPGGSGRVAERIIKELKKDCEKANKNAR